MQYEYSDEELDRLEKEYNRYGEEYGETWEKLTEKINSLNAPEKDVMYFRESLCIELAKCHGGGGFRFSKKESKQDAQLKRLYLETARHFPKDSHYWYWSVYYFYRKDYANVHKTLQNWCKKEGDEEFLAESAWHDLFFLPFKEAYPGFWRELAALLRKNGYPETLSALCDLMEEYYACKTQEETENVLLDFVQTHPETATPKDCLAFLYEETKRWYNAIQCYEQLEDFFLENATLYFRLAWCYSKVKEYDKEEEYYRKCLEIFPQYIYALNNLGYCLYRQKRYDEAEKIFLQCLEENRDLPYPANNLVRTYLRLGKNQEAKEFVAAKKFKVNNNLIKQVEQRPSENTVVDSAPLADMDDDEETAEASSESGREPEKQQFSSEKILEDELVARIEAGYEVFGRKLKIYRRKGDFYGRQYPCSNGEKRWRLDILCEDEEGNVHIIELKKDSGYDDAYQQTKEYVDYFEKHRVTKGKKAYGIICLNSPTDDVMKKVRQDDRIRLFEYKISYDEMK